MSNEVVKHQSEALIRQQEKLQELQVLIDSKALPKHITSVEVAFTIVEFGRELGIPTMQALHEIFPVNGKLGMSARLQAALAIKHNITMTLVRDLEYVYIDEKGVVLYSKYKIPNRPFWDRETVILFERKMPNGTVNKQEVSFTYKDAEAAGVLSKDNWKHWLKNMMIARCTTKGLNLIAPDVMRGLLTLDEMHDIGWIKEDHVKRDEDGLIQEVTFEEVK